MVAQELGRIAGVQHHTAGYRNLNLNPEHTRSIYDKPLDFEVWFNGCLKHYQAKGFKLSWKNLTIINVVFPDGSRGARTIESFHEEYEEDYKTQFPNCN